MTETTNKAEPRLTKNPKLGFLGWGLAGGFYMGGVPGCTFGSIGIACLVLGVFKTYARIDEVSDPELQARLFGLTVLFLVMAVVCLFVGYQRYSSAYDKEREELRLDNPGTNNPRD